MADALYYIINCYVRRGTCQYLLSPANRLNYQLTDSGRLASPWRPMDQVALLGPAISNCLILLLIHFLAFEELRLFWMISCSAILKKQVSNQGNILMWALEKVEYLEISSISDLVPFQYNVNFHVLKILVVIWVNIHCYFNFL